MWIAIVVLGPLGTLRGQSQPQDINREMEEAKALYRGADFTEAILKLQGIITRMKVMRDVEARKVQLGDAYLHLALSYFAVDDGATAKETFKSVARVDPARRLDPQIYAPGVIALFEEARAEVGKEPPGTSGLLPQTPPQGKKGGSKTPLILLGVGGAAVAAVGVATGGGDSGGAGPPRGVLRIDVSPFSGQALVAATEISFFVRVDDGVSPSDGAWDFGDGGTASGLTARHLFQTEGTFNVLFTANDGRTARITITARTLTGVWDGQTSRGEAFVLQMTQTGPNLDGRLSGRITFSGRVQGFRHLLVTFQGCDEGRGPSLSGDANDTLTIVAGSSLGNPFPCGAIPVQVTLTRRP